MYVTLTSKNTIHSNCSSTGSYEHQSNCNQPIILRALHVQAHKNINRTITNKPQHQQTQYTLNIVKKTNFSNTLHVQTQNCFKLKFISNSPRITLHSYRMNHIRQIALEFWKNISQTCF